MKCNNCANNNPDDAFFCEYCGNPFIRVCPNCGNEVSTQAKFCRHCGFAFSDLVTPRTLPQISSLSQSAPNEIRVKMSQASGNDEAIELARTLVQPPQRKLENGLESAIQSAIQLYDSGDIASASDQLKIALNLAEECPEGISIPGDLYQS